MTEISVENDRLKTKVKVLQSELHIQKDLEQSVEKARFELEKSEQARQEL